MANTNGATDVAKTPSKDQDANGQAEPTEEEGANGQLPDSTCTCRRNTSIKKKLIMCRHLPNQDQAAPRALRNAYDGPHTIPMNHVKKLTMVDFNGGASARFAPIHH
jgi:hypothetical protein